MPSEKRDPDCASGITSSWLNPDSVEGTFPQQSSIRNRIERDSAGHHEIRLSCFPPRVSRQGEHDVFQYRLNRRGQVHFAAQPRRTQTTPATLAELTEREREVMTLVGAGRSNDEIAEHLVITPATAKTHVSRAMAKLGARDRAQLVVIAYETGLVTPGR